MRPMARSRTPARFRMPSPLERDDLPVQGHLGIGLALEDVIVLGQPVVVVGLGLNQVVSVRWMVPGNRHITEGPAPRRKGRPPANLVEIDNLVNQQRSVTMAHS